MKNLSILQQLQSVQPKPESRKYSVYEVENVDGNIKIAIPAERVSEFDSELENCQWDSIEAIVEKYEGFVVTK